ncbi:MAG: prenyltransferase/squalene oxidase repeat-containing protein, partial [Pirellulaceae bacterium]
SAYGGNRLTEEAVQNGLEWLRKNQLKDGTWSLTRPYSSAGLNDDRTSATAMALLAFQGAGHTHQTGMHQKTVAKGWDALLAMQRPNGDFWRGSVLHHRLYAQAQATIAICELYGMTQDSRFRDPAQRAIDYAVEIQDVRGGWRYTPGSDSDTSVTGWFVMALQSAQMADLKVPQRTLDNVARFLDSVQSEYGATYAYRPGEPATFPMTAEALLCRQYLGWKRTDDRLVTGVHQIGTTPIDWADKNVYYWYYATQVMHHMEGDAWEEWNAVLRQVIPAHQTKDGPEAGSWSPSGDRWGGQGGRLYTTCFCIYMLEVYYRHLPIYSNAFR